MIYDPNSPQAMSQALLPQMAPAQPPMQFAEGFPPTVVPPRNIGSQTYGDSLNNMGLELKLQKLFTPGELDWIKNLPKDTK